MVENISGSNTIRDVARLAHVSVATVSRVINKNTPVSEDVETRVRAAMQELRYFPKSAARNLSNQNTHTIGFILDDMVGGFMGPMLSGIESIAAEQGFHLLIASTRFQEGNLDFPLPLGPHNTDGLLIYANSIPDDKLRSLYELGFPIVLIHRTPPKEMKIPSVTIENKQASEEVTTHLIEVHQRRRIVFLRGPQDEEDSHWREAGYRQAHARHQLSVFEELVCPGEFNRDVAFQSICRLIEQKIKFDAVFSGDDEAAVGVLKAFRHHGIRCPQEVSLVGFDDQNIATCLYPQLTTVYAPTLDVGRVAATQLIKILNGQEPQTLSLLQTQMIIRESCGC